MAYTNIDDPSALFQTKTYTGAGNTSFPVSKTFDGNSDLKPDMIWSACRSNTQHVWLMDSSRTFAGNKEILSNSNNVEGDTGAVNSGAYGWLGPGLTNGFSISQANNYWDVNARTYVAWCWKCNDASTTSFSESGNNPGGTKQVNTDAGFGIYTYTGTGANANCLIAHGLPSKPKWVIIKRRDAANLTLAWHDAIGVDYKMNLNNLNARDADGAFFNGTVPDATNITLGGTSTNTNADNGTYVMYAWSEVQGYSKFGKYVGTNNADGPFVYTGFKPKYVILKGIAHGEHWVCFDTERDEYNGGPSPYKFLNETELERNVEERIDFLSNGFKIRSSGAAWNSTNAAGLLYVAFAENPFTTSTGIPTTAR
jgi:hypothetical protein